MGQCSSNPVEARQNPNVSGTDNGVSNPKETAPPSASSSVPAGGAKSGAEAKKSANGDSPSREVLRKASRTKDEQLHQSPSREVLLNASRTNDGEIKSTPSKPPRSPSLTSKSTSVRRKKINMATSDQAPPSDLQDFVKNADRCIDVLNEKYGAETGLSSASDAVVVMEGWNKVLAFQTMFTESLVGRWRLLVATEELARRRKEGEKGGLGSRSYATYSKDGEEKKEERIASPSIKSLSSRSRSFRSISKAGNKKQAKNDDELLRTALVQVDTNSDPLAQSLGTRLDHARTLLLGMLDCAARSLCPHTQVVQRESYRPIQEDMRLDVDAAGTNALNRFALTEGTIEEYGRLFARCGVEPAHWITFCDAFLWAIRTHNPYADEVDGEDLERPTTESAHSAFVSAYVAKPAIEEAKNLRMELDTPLYKVALRRWWSRVSARPDAKTDIGETFYRDLLTNHPELLDYFAKADMDSLAVHIVMSIDLMVKSIDKVGVAGSAFRKVLDHLGEMHRRLSIPTYSFPIVGGQLLKTLGPFFKEEEELTRETDMPATADELEQALAVVYTEVMSLTYHPMVREEKLVADAENFLNSLAKELNWSPDRLSRRLMEVKLEISASGTYTHTSEEIEIGARLAWRNSAKCIGRIAWNTLMVRDARGAETPEEVFREVKEHLKVATSGTNIQSVMTVFKPKSPAEAWGMRFWSSQFVRYAGYKTDTGAIMGDPANLEFTDFLIRNQLWTPPKTRTQFDVLPLVLKIPGIHKPFVYQLPNNFVDEVEIEHPDCPAVKKLGLRWAAVPAISNFNMNLGGVDYQCCPFNGWFCSIEIVRNLLERYKVQDEWADAMKLDKKQAMLEMRIQHEVQVAVIHSFEKNGFTMVDPVNVGNSFMVHCKRERDAGRECPGQWSWIGGLVGPTNVTWHKEMRDFRLLPQYDYCCEHWMVTDLSDLADGRNSDLFSDSSDKTEVASTNADALGGGNIPRVLIAYGSETGTAEAAALRLGRALRLCKPIIKCLDDVAGLSIIKEQRITHFLALCSTFNRGEFPSNAAKFSQMEIPPNTLAGTKVAVLALGSTLYPDYCKAGVQLDQKLSKAGGRALATFTKANDATGSEGAIAEWLQLVERLVLPKHLASALQARMVKKSAPVEYRVKWLGTPEKFKWSEKEPMQQFKWPEKDSVLCVGNDELIANGDIKSRSTRAITFRLPEGIKYESGDHLAVHPLNSLESIRRLATCIGDELIDAAAAGDSCPFKIGKGQNSTSIISWQLSQPLAVDCIDDGDAYPAQLPFKTPTTLLDALQAHVDLTFRASNLADVLGIIHNSLDALDSSGNSKDLDKGNVQRKLKLQQFYNQTIKGHGGVRQAAIDAFLSKYPTIVTFLEEFSPLLCSRNVSVKKDRLPLLPLAQLLALLPRLQARYYSISSSPRMDPSKVSISVGVVHVQTPAGVMIHGVCSNYLARLRTNKDRVNLSVRTSSFRGPTEIKAPVVMIGTGTGLAPMMGFLADRAYSMESMEDAAKAGECHLYFGCRSGDDRIYAEQIDDWESSGVLNHHLALSRAPNTPKTYVQNLLEKQGAHLCKLLLQQDTHYYICGDAKVADYCYEECVKLLRTHGNMSRVAAVQHIKRMRAQDRWQFDLWGIISHFNEAKVEVRKKKEASAREWLRTFAD